MRAHYEGPLHVSVLGDGREMQLLSPFAFVDHSGYRWEVYAGTRIDGSSIPRLLWWLVGSPYVGKHRWASVPHDLYCRVRVRSADDTHRMYHEAMLVAGVPGAEADRKYRWLRQFGPTWPDPIMP